MPDEVTLDVTTIEENVTVETTAGDVVEIQVVAPTGPTGATGPAGPNSVTSATTSDGTANLSLSNVSTTTATVSGLLTAGHIHGNLAGTLYTHVRTGEAMSKGDPFYISGFHVGSSQPIAMKADASNAAKMPAVGVMDADYANNTSGANGIISGTLSSVNTNGYTVNSPIYVADGGGYSNTAGTIPQQVGITERDNANTGAFIVTSPKLISFADITDSETGTATLGLSSISIYPSGKIYYASTNSGGFVGLSGQLATDARDVYLPNASGNLALVTSTTGQIASADVSGLTALATTTPAANVANFLATPTSANLASALTDENGTGGGFVRAEGATLTSPSLVGPVNLTSQDASTADRVMNRALFDFRLFEQSEGLWMFRQGDIIATNVGSGITDSNGGVSLFSGGTANSVSLARIHGGGVTALPMYRLDWSRALVFSGFITASATTPNGIGRLLLGVPQATTTPVDLTNKGIGIRCVGSAITLVVHNGTTLTTSATVGTLSSAVQYFRIVCDGAGNVQLYLNKVLVASTSLGPTGAAVEVGLTASATNNADAAIQRFGCGLLKIWTL